MYLCLHATTAAMSREIQQQSEAPDQDQDQDQNSEPEHIQSVDITDVMDSSDDSLGNCPLTTEDWEKLGKNIEDGFGADAVLYEYMYAFTKCDWERFAVTIAEFFDCTPEDPLIKSYVEQLQNSKQSHP